MKCYTDRDGQSDHFHDLDVDQLEAEEDDGGPLRCLECRISFLSKDYLYRHLLHHVRQPYVKLEQVQQRNPPLKITFKNRSGNSFEIVSPVTSPSSSEPGCPSNSLDEAPRDQEESHYYGDDLVDHTDNLGDEFPEGPFEDFGNDLVEPDQPGPDVRHCFEDIDETPSGPPQESPLGSTSSDRETPEGRGSNNFSPNLAEVIGGAFLTDLDSPFDDQAAEDPLEGSGKGAPAGQGGSTYHTQGGGASEDTANVETLPSDSQAMAPHYGGIPGAEPTPPPEPSPTGTSEYPKIKIKTTGLFKDPEPRGCTITEITDDNPSGDPNLSSNNTPTPVWTNSNMDDPLKLPDSDSLLSMFNNERSNKDMGYTPGNDNEFISLDTFNERNRNAMQLYNPSGGGTVATTSSLDSLTGLPMQALAQQVSRLNPSTSQGLHQQNVLINIQQFPTQPQQQYQPQHSQMPPHQPMYPPHYPAHPGQPPMHQPYGYQPPPYAPYPPAPGYPPQPSHMPPPPPHPMGQMQPPPMGQMQPPQMGQQAIGAPGQPPNLMVPASQSQPMPPPSQPPNSMHGGYRAPMPPNGRPPPPRGPQQSGARTTGGLRPPMGNRAPGARPRAPLVRPRGNGHPAMVRGQMRPRMSGPQNGQRPGAQNSPIKREGDHGVQSKRRKVDILTPSDKDDDDCQVICIQPKNTGLPQIESVQGGPESVENSIMKLSDSITLSVRNPPPKPVASPQKSDAKAVANVLASRGITVTASGKSKESPTKQASAAPTSLSLNGAVSIVAKNLTPTKSPPAESIPTVDLTDDAAPSAQNKNRPVLPYRCDLCPAQYPNSAGLAKHRQTYHKTSSGMCELGVPLINMKQPGVLQRLGQLGIFNYIPLPGGGADGNYALPIVNSKNPGNVAALGATQMLTLGPVRSIPRPSSSANSNNNVKK